MSGVHEGKKVSCCSSRKGSAKELEELCFHLNTIYKQQCTVGITGSSTNNWQ
jgi:hypothetical protein